MLKLPFARKPKDEDAERSSVAFADYCREELERLRDSGGAFDEEEFRAAVDLAIGRLEALENEEKA